MNLHSENMDYAVNAKCMGFNITKTCLFKYILKISPPKTESFQIKIDIFHISAQNIDFGYSSEYRLWVLIKNCLTNAVLMSTNNLCF